MGSFPFRNSSRSPVTNHPSARACWGHESRLTIPLSPCPTILLLFHLSPVTGLLRPCRSHVPCYTVPPMARQRLGQHFLADLHWREEIARAIRVSPHSTLPLPKDDQHCWVEIGSGHGEMTQHLLATGAPIHAIEID